MSIIEALCQRLTGLVTQGERAELRLQILAEPVLQARRGVFQRHTVVGQGADDALLFLLEL